MQFILSARTDNIKRIECLVGVQDGLTSLKHTLDILSSNSNMSQSFLLLLENLLLVICYDLFEEVGSNMDQ